MRLYDYAASGNCFKVRLLLGLLGREYERVPVDIFAGDTLTDAFGALNPLRETPVLELDDGRRLTQSNAICGSSPRAREFLPADAFARGEVASWLSFEQERVMGGIGGPRFRALTGRPFDASRLQTGRGALRVLDDHLAVREWLVGDAPTIADVGVFAYSAGRPTPGSRSRRTSRRGWSGCARCPGSPTTSSAIRTTRGPAARARSMTR